MTGHSKRATKALQRMAEDDPALAVLSLWCTHIDGVDPAPATSNGSAISYGPSFDALTLPEQVGLTAHHVLHIAFGHSVRAQALADRMGDGFDRTLFNLGADGLINEVLVLAGYALPRPAVLASELLAEAMADRSDPSKLVQSTDAEALYFALCHPANGNGETQKDAARDYARTSEFSEDLTPAGQAQPQKADDPAEWQGRLARALAEGRRAGRGIGALGFRFADMPQSRTPWSHILRGFLAKALGQAPRPAPLRPARRWLALDAHARQTGGASPAFEAGFARRIEQPRLVVGLDMSSSVDDTLLAQFAGEVARIAARAGAEIHLLLFDDIVQACHLLRPPDIAGQIARMRVARDGGTDFVPVLDEAALLAPSAIVILSDLDGPLGAPPPVPLIWACPDRPLHTPPYGRVIVLDR